MNEFRYSILYIVDVCFALLETAIGLRFLLKLFGANPQSSFVSWVYTNTSELINPFIGAFPTHIGRTGSVLELSSLLALLVYGILGYFVIYILSILLHTHEPVSIEG